MLKQSLVAAILLSSQFCTAETIGKILDVKSGQTTIRLLRDTIVRHQGVACTATVEVADVSSVAHLTNLPTRIQVGTLRYCGEIEHLNIEPLLKLAEANGDVLPVTTSSQLTEMIYINPGNPVGQQCVRQILNELTLTLSTGGKIKTQNGYDLPGAPTAETCVGLRN